MTQRLVACVVGLLVGLTASVAACSEPTSYEAARAQALECPTATAWTSPAGSLWTAHCGDADGNEIDPCQPSAELHYAISGGDDAAYEDALAACHAGTTFAAFIEESR